jgi:NAD+ synthase (glutamine-hydrolysing)
MEIRLYLAQINPTVGDLKGNCGLILSHIKKACDNNADIVIFPELSLTGYPPQDLLLRNSFLNENTAYIEKIKEEVSNITAIVGFAHNKNGIIYNSAAVIRRQTIKCIYNKQHLSGYSVFDENRYFGEGEVGCMMELKDHLLGLYISEDIFYASEPARPRLIKGGAELIINISASPYYTGRVESREKAISTLASDNLVNIAYINMAGGQDELVFDGNSFVVDERGNITARCRPFAEDSLVADIELSDVSRAGLKNKVSINPENSMKLDYSSIKLVELDAGYAAKKPAVAVSKIKAISGDIKYTDFISCPEEEILEALVLGTRDYIKKNSFNKVLVALSGGIDSALIAFIAVRAVGKENVTAVFMPSDYSSGECLDDSKKLSDNLGIEYVVIPISGIYKSYLEDLKGFFKINEINITRENIQARIRGNIIMAFSNEHGGLVLSTGNKSEISVGYCTLYGDMVGGFSPIKDVYKTMVYSICSFINKKYNFVIPERIISRPPSAELRPGQTDQDSLPPYSTLDSILKAYIEEDKDFESMINIGFEPDMVKYVINMVNSSEYKRRQGAPGINITARAIRENRKYPITNKFRPQL